eukprot:gene30540-36909_t
MASKHQRSVFADEAILDQHHCRRVREQHKIAEIEGPWSIVREETELQSEVLIHPSGWKFHAFHRHILHEDETKKYVRCIKQQLLSEFPSVRAKVRPDEEAEWLQDDHMKINDFHIHTPPMLFGADLLLFENPLGGLMNISAADAIYSWVAKHTEESVSRHPLHVPKVPYSHGWLASMRSTISAARDTVPPSPPPHGSPAVATHFISNPPPQSRLPDEEAIVRAVKAHDWTYSTDYCCTLYGLADAADTGSSRVLKTLVQARKLPSALNAPAQLPGFLLDEALSCSDGQTQTQGRGRWTVEARETSGVDYDMLRRRDLPILFYDEALLFQDDLEDCGEVSLEAKVRVMPTCLLLLLRLFLRVDQCVVRCRETRVFHAFPTDSQPQDAVSLHVEVVWRELEVSAGVDVSRVGESSGVRAMAAYTKDSAHTLPQVNAQEGVGQFFTLTFTN